MIARVFLGAVLAAFIWGIAPAQADVRAVLVGVSDYDDAIGLTDLKGPANDVILLRDVLTARGVSDITLLADGVPGGTVPTRAAILGAFDDLAARARSGDLIYVHLSGHGTRQFDPQGDETDGLDEVFLPSDTARAEPGTNLIPNAIIDDEIGQALDAIRQTGADVWLVMDSCHSGSGLRAASPGTAARFVDPAALGVDIHASGQIEPEIIETTGAEPAGGLLAFYAARSSEVAREVDLSAAAGAAGDGSAWYGLFTSKIAARLQSSSNLSYRQLFQGVLSDMKDGSVPGGARMQSPLWEGTMIDAAVFGGRSTSGVRRFAVTGDEISAGLVHGLGDGTLVALVGDAADAPDAVIGWAQMEETKATRAYLRPVSPDCIPHSAERCDYAGDLPAKARFAQIMARPVDLVVRLSRPIDLATGAALAADAPPMQALQQAIATLNSGPDARIELDPSGFTVEVYWARDQLWFGPRAVIGGEPVGLGVAADPAALVAALRRIGKAEELARLLASVSGKSSMLNPNPVTITSRLLAVKTSDLAAPGSRKSPKRECEAAIGASPGTATELPENADLKQCDRLAFSVQGRVAGARDVNRIYIDSQFCIRADHELVEDNAAARDLGPGMMICSDCPDGYSAGEERMFVVVTESETHAEPLNLEGLLENCTVQDPATRGANTGHRDVRSFLSGLTQRPGTRGQFGSFNVSNVWVQDFNWRVLPKSEAFLKAGLAPKPAE